MATLEDELKDLKEKNNELAQKAQYWKMTAAQKDDEKLALMKEVNELRLKLTRLKNNGGFQARKLDAALQDASEKAISHLVNASAEIAKSMEIAKAYMRDRQELDVQSPRWSNIGGTPTEKSDRVHRVPPMMIGGQSLHPVVALNRVMLNTSNPRSTTRSPNQNRSLTERAVPMHMLQDVYIPLTRIDISDLPNNNIEMEVDDELEANNAEDSPVDFAEHRLGDNDDDDDSLDSDEHISEGDEYDRSRLEPVSEEETGVNDTSTEIEPVSLRLQNGPREDRWHRPDPPRDKQPEPPQDKQPTPPGGGGSFENPLEGPSWLLDDTPSTSTSFVNSKKPATKSGRSLEPDSTTKVEKTPNTSHQKSEENTELQSESSPTAARAFSPTVRRRKRTSSPPPLATPRQPHYSPRPNSSRRNSTNGRVLKVVLAKMRLDGSPGEVGSPSGAGDLGGAGGPGGPGGPGGSPPKRARSPRCGVFDAPSPNGATDSRVIVSESGTRLDSAITEHSIRTTLRESLENQARANSLERETQHTSRRRFSREHDNSRRVASVHERRHNNQDGRDSHHRGRLTSQETRDSGQSSRQRSRLDSHDSRLDGHDSRLEGHDSRDSDSGSGGAGDSLSEGRTRRARKAVTYKEKPLNRKLRR